MNSQSRAARIWAIVAEPKTVTVIMAVIYAALFMAGLAAWDGAPTAVAATVGEPLSTIWAVTLIVAGVCGVAGAIPGWYWLEKGGIIGGFFTSLTYMLSLISQSHLYPATDYRPQAALLLVVALMFIIRWERVKGLTVDPTRQKL